MPNTASQVCVNDITYRWPLRPVVVVCVDGGDPAYLRQFLPSLGSLVERAVPLHLSRPMGSDCQVVDPALRHFDALAAALNGTHTS